MKILFDFLITFLMAIQFLVFLFVIFSWFPQTRQNPFVIFVSRAVAPIFRIFPKIRIGFLDLTPLVIFLTVEILTKIVIYLAEKF